MFSLPPHFITSLRPPSVHTNSVALANPIHPRYQRAKKSREESPLTVFRDSNPSLSALCQRSTRELHHPEPPLFVGNPNKKRFTRSLQPKILRAGHSLVANRNTSAANSVKSKRLKLPGKGTGLESREQTIDETRQPWFHSELAFVFVSHICSRSVRTCTKLQQGTSEVSRK